MLSPYEMVQGGSCSASRYFGPRAAESTGDGFGSQRSRVVSFEVAEDEARSGKPKVGVQSRDGSQKAKEGHQGSILSPYRIISRRLPLRRSAR
jgi:hypothetical protein